jgi:hypothetical protein
VLLAVAVIENVFFVPGFLGQLKRALAPASSPTSRWFRASRCGARC